MLRYEVDDHDVFSHSHTTFWQCRFILLMHVQRGCLVILNISNRTPNIYLSLYIYTGVAIVLAEMFIILYQVYIVW